MSAYCLKSAEQSAELGARLAAAAPFNLHRTLSLALQGELGAGKTTLAQGLLRRLGVTGAVHSPSYTLVEHYDTLQGLVLHVDLYRLNSTDELEALGLRDEWSNAALVLLEWPERAGSLLPTADLRVQLGGDGDSRAAQFTASSRVGRLWLAALEK
jgi:tRNA threonylcarbamoyladenosine biosynthesis protein TsaE